MPKGSHRRLQSSHPETLCFRVRRNLDMSQKEFAEYLNNRGFPCAENTVWNWERGRPLVWYYQQELEKIARARGVSTLIEPQPPAPKPSPKNPNCPFRVGDLVQRKHGPKVTETGEVLHLSKDGFRCKVRWASGIERGYDVKTLGKV